MKVGDAVKFIGFTEHRSPPWPSDVGVIIEIHFVHAVKRCTVSWPDGTIGNWLYPDTLEVVSEAGR